jgi:hypothetical protein
MERNGDEPAAAPVTTYEQIDLGATLAQVREVVKVQGELIGELTMAVRAQEQGAERRAGDVRDLTEALYGLMDMVRELRDRSPLLAATPDPETELGARLRAAHNQAAVLYAYLTGQADLTTREDLDKRIDVLGDDYQCIILEMAELARQLGQGRAAKDPDPYDEEPQLGASR